MSKLVRFFTVGCKVNQYETQALREQYLKKGYRESAKEEPADLYVINTCTVTGKADKDSRRYIHHAKKINPKAKIVVTGCLVEKDEEEISSIPGVKEIIKNSEKPEGISGFSGHTRVFVKIQDGCNNFCSYCKVPFVRGRSRSRSEKAILDEISRLLDKGFKEIVLSGICLGEWGKDLKEPKGLRDLLQKITAIKKDFRIRLSSIEPNLVTSQLIETIKSSPKICSHLHIPLQSGSDKILKLMNRPYKARDYIKLILKIRKEAPDFSISTDVLTGFPGEGKREFRNTLKVIKKILPVRLHAFPYSPRKGTKAYGLMPIVEKPELKQRVKTLQALGKALSAKYRKKFLKKCVRVLVEHTRDRTSGLFCGYTDTYIRVLIQEDKPNDHLSGQLIPARLTKLDQKSSFCTTLLTRP